MATYKIAGKIQKVTFDGAAKMKSIFVIPDQEYSLKNSDKNYAILMPNKDNAFQALAVEYKKEIEFEFKLKMKTSFSLEAGKRVEMELEEEKASGDVTLKQKVEEIDSSGVKKEVLIEIKYNLKKFSLLV